MCENYGGAFSLAGTWTIGANCLANPRDSSPMAAYEDHDTPSLLQCEMGRCFVDGKN